KAAQGPHPTEIFLENALAQTRSAEKNRDGLSSIPKRSLLSLEAVNEPKLKRARPARAEEFIGGLRGRVEVGLGDVVIEAGEIRVHEATDVRRVGQVKAFRDEL